MEQDFVLRTYVSSFHTIKSTRLLLSIYTDFYTITFQVKPGSHIPAVCRRAIVVSTVQPNDSQKNVCINSCKQ